MEEWKPADEIEELRFRVQALEQIVNAFTAVVDGRLARPLEQPPNWFRDEALHIIEEGLSGEPNAPWHRWVARRARYLLLQDAHPR